MITRDSFAKEYDKFAKALTRRVKAYLRDPNAENVHRLRTATRRLQAAFALLPKTSRKQTKAQKTMARIKKLMKANASVRDQDIILSKLSMYKQSPAYGRLIEDLRKSRKSHLEQAKELALSVQKNPAPRAKPKELSDPILQKRYNKVVRRLSSKITSELPIVREDPSKVEELHAVRRDGKQLRYVLEMGEFSRPPRPLVSLRSWQDLLGTIRDHDVMITYLRGLSKSPEIQSALNTEVEGRNNGYRKFVEASRENPVSRFAAKP
ncbi:MAG TPA: CHAD domain-containing protein [Candidatus Bathyarchaeia archaeon]|nr:CHAD domain-containing protein [Candidatus Bathyarchaeia archaeon]